MNKRINRLSPVRDYAQREEQNAARAFAAANGELAGSQRTLDELKQYRASYSSRAGDQTQWSAAHWRDYHEFLSRLNKAIEAQEEIVEQGSTRRDVHAKKWSGKRVREKSLETLSSKLMLSAKREQERQQQKELDAIVSQRPRRGVFSR